MLRKHNITPGLSKKLAPKYEGPYYINKVCPNHTFNLRKQADHKPLRARVHANRLKAYNNPVLRRYAEMIQPQQQPIPIQDNEKDQTEQTSTQDGQNQEPAQEANRELAEPNYFVEKILASTNYKGEKLYIVKWLGLKNTTWERKSTLFENLVNEFNTVPKVAKGSVL